MRCCQPLARAQGEWSRSDADGKTENTVIKQLNVITSYRKHDWSKKKRPYSYVKPHQTNGRFWKVTRVWNLTAQHGAGKKRWRLTTEELRTEWRLRRFDPEAITVRRLDYTRHYSFPIQTNWRLLVRCRWQASGRHGREHTDRFVRVGLWLKLKLLIAPNIAMTSSCYFD